MKRSISLKCLIFLACLISIQSEAKIWRVNNRANTNPDFTTAQAAHNGASAGDTLYFEPSPTSYGNLTLSKKMIILGPGYFLDQNPETQWKTLWGSTIGTLLFSDNPSSSGSQVMGMTCTGTVTVYSSNLTIRRNYFQSPVNFAQSSDPVADIEFAENYCGNTFSMSGQQHDIVIRNNIFLITMYNTSAQISGSVTHNGTFRNNIIIGYTGDYTSDNINLNYFQVQNNFASQVSFYVNYNEYTNNIADNGCFGSQNGNFTASVSSVFVNSGSTDGKYTLKSGSPAIGAGAGGVDCGVFGGSYPYVLSGLPPVPAIYYYTIDQNASQFNVNLKVKSHN